MAMGQQKDRQGDLMVGWAEMPRSPGHVFYDRLQSVLIEGGFDAFAEASCRPYYAARMGAPSAARALWSIGSPALPLLVYRGPTMQISIRC